MKKGCGLALLLLSVVFFSVEKNDTYAADLFDPGFADISIKVKNDVIPYKEFAFYVLPGETIPIEIDKNPTSNIYSLYDMNGLSPSIIRNKWNWKAPEKVGVYSIDITNKEGIKQITLNIFVMIPFNQLRGQFLKQFRIGHYPKIAYHQLEIYKNPPGFIEITERNKNTSLSPHFRVNQFLSRQQGGYPKYLVLKERLVLKLELVLLKTNERGYYAPTFLIMSGYRTPFYNELIGNVKYSRHLWGDAADIFLDENPKDGVMDDLNKDGVINSLDTAVLYDTIDDLHGKPFYEVLTGGLGKYERTRNHGPFVHLDVRGFRVRWGD